MKKILAVAVLCILLAFVFFGSLSCGGKTEGTVTQAEYDALKAQLAGAEAQIASLMSKTVAPPTTDAGLQKLNDEIASLQNQLKSLGDQIASLTQQNDALTQAKAAADAQYADLNTRYQDLQKLMASTTLPDSVTEEQIEDTIFNLLNQERVKAGLSEFIKGQYLYPQARQNSRNMAAAGKFIYDPAVFYQELFWAAGYNSLDPIARGALLTWKANTYNFEHGALLPANIYGAVGAYKSGEVVYITFMAANFQ